MKYKQLYQILLLIVFFSTCATAIEARAMTTGFETEELSEEEKTVFLSNVDLSLLQTEPEKKSIRCFDVNEERMIAIGQDGSGEENAEICVYDSQGIFLYGYSFNRSGSISVEWNHEYINIMFFRSRVIISVDSEGNIFDIKDVPSTVDNSIYLDSLKSPFRKVGDTIYRVRNRMGPLNLIAFSFSQIVIIDPSGNERIIYDVNTEQLIKTIVALSIIGILVVAGVVFFVKTCIRLKRGK